MKYSASLAVLSAVLLAACGGGGSDGSTSSSTATTTATTTPSTTTTTSTPPVATNTVQAQFDAGVFFFGGAGSTVNGVDQSYIRKVANSSVVSGNTSLVMTRYAGADAIFTNGLFDYMPYKPLGSTGWALTSAVPEFSYGAGSAATLVMDYPSLSVPDVKWTFSIMATDVSGTPIDTYLQSLRTAANTTAVTGNFGVNAKSLLLTYTAAADFLGAAFFNPDLRDNQFKAVTTMSGLVNTTTCLRNVGNYLVMQYQSDGVIELYDTSALALAARCTSTPPVATLIGAAAFVQKPYGVHTYLEITFPASFDFSRYNAAFSKAAYDAGVKFAIAQPAQGLNWAYAYFIPQGVAVTDPTAYMNQEAAAAVKTALSLP